MQGMKVGMARRKYIEQATKDGEQNVEERYSLPNLYVDGNTKNSKAFNCVQRAHQQVFGIYYSSRTISVVSAHAVVPDDTASTNVSQAWMTLPQFQCFTGVSMLTFPLTAGGVVGMWLVGRVVWTKGYMESAGQPGKRYDHPLAYWIFASVIAQFLLAMGSAGEISGLWPAVRGLLK